MYVAFEGIEGAGKSSVAAHIAQRLRGAGRDVLEVREPGGTPAGEEIRQVLLHFEGAVAPWTEALLFAAARSQLVAGPVTAALQAGRWVVSDRSVYSSLAYQGVGRRLGVELVRTVNEIGLAGVWPELVVLLRLDVAAGLARQAVPDRIGGEDAALHETVASAFDGLAAAEPDRFVVVDAARPIVEVVDDVWSVLRARLPVA